MRFLRTVSLMVVFGFLVWNPTALGFDAQCCSEFIGHCDNWCRENGHGGELITQCGPPSCTELCFCTGTCGIQHCTHEDAGGTWCAPCSQPQQ